MMEKVVMRDGFKIGGGMTYVVENWENMRFAQGELFEEVDGLLEKMEDSARERLINPQSKVYDEWLNNKHYSPDRAEKIRRQALEKVLGGVKQ